MIKGTKVAAEAAELMIDMLQVHKRVFHTVAKDNALSPQQLATLLQLEPEIGTPMNVLAEYLMCDASNVTGIVDKLEARGLAKRGQGEDRRVKVLTLTEEGVALRRSVRERLLTPPGWLLGLSREDQLALRDILRRGKGLL